MTAVWCVGVWSITSVAGWAIQTFVLVKVRGDIMLIQRPRLEDQVADYLANSRAMAADSNKVPAVQGKVCKPGLPAGRIG